MKLKELLDSLEVQFDETDPVMQMEVMGLNERSGYAYDLKDVGVDKETDTITLYVTTR